MTEVRGKRNSWCWKEIKRDKGKNGEGCYMRLANLFVETQKAVDEYHRGAAYEN